MHGNGDEGYPGDVDSGMFDVCWGSLVRAAEVSLGFSLLVSKSERQILLVRKVTRFYKIQWLSCFSTLAFAEVFSGAEKDDREYIRSKAACKFHLISPWILIDKHIIPLFKADQHFWVLMPGGQLVSPPGSLGSFIVAGLILPFVGTAALVNFVLRFPLFCLSYLFTGPITLWMLYVMIEPCGLSLRAFAYPASTAVARNQPMPHYQMSARHLAAFIAVSIDGLLLALALGSALSACGAGSLSIGRVVKVVALLTLLAQVLTYKKIAITSDVISRLALKLVEKEKEEGIQRLSNANCSITGSPYVGGTQPSDDIGYADTERGTDECDVAECDVAERGTDERGTDECDVECSIAEEGRSNRVDDCAPNSADIEAAICGVWWCSLIGGLISPDLFASNSMGDITATGIVREALSLVGNIISGLASRAVVGCCRASVPMSEERAEHFASTLLSVTPCLQQHATGHFQCFK